MKNIYLQIIDHQSDKSAPVLATVVRTKGSAPQKPGSSAIFNESGLVSGTVGGGAVEGAIQKIGVERSLSGNSGYFHFNLANDISRKEEAICGGQITIIVDARPLDHLSVFQQIERSIGNNDPGVLVTMVTRLSEEITQIQRYWMSRNFTPSIQADILTRIHPVVNEMISHPDPACFIEMELSHEGDEKYVWLFIEPVLAPLKLVIAGAGHIGRALSHIGRMLGFEVTVIDDRPEYANNDNIPDADRIMVKEIGEAVRDMNKSPDTFLVIVTRGHKDDADALRSCMGSDLAYVGMIGSRKKIEAMRTDFIEKGWATPEHWSAVHTPIGLEINSQTVEEIAVSIAAELILVKNSRREKKAGCPA